MACNHQSDSAQSSLPIMSRSKSLSQPSTQLRGISFIYFSKNKDISRLKQRVIILSLNSVTAEFSKLPSMIVSLLRSKTLYFQRWLQIHSSSWMISSLEFEMKQAGAGTALPGLKSKVRNILREGVPQISTRRSCRRGGKVNLASLMMFREVSQRKLLLTTSVLGVMALASFFVVAQNRSRTSGWNSHSSTMAIFISLIPQGVKSGSILTVTLQQWLCPFLIWCIRISIISSCLLWFQTYLECVFTFRTRQDGSHTSFSAMNWEYTQGDDNELCSLKTSGQQQYVSIIRTSSWSPFQWMHSRFESQKKSASH